MLNHCLTIGLDLEILIYLPFTLIFIFYLIICPLLEKTLSDGTDMAGYT